MVFIFLYCSTLSVQKKLKNLIFKIPVIPQILSINNLRTTSAKSTYLYHLSIYLYQPAYQ